jgi:hypothetical protein
MISTTMKKECGAKTGNLVSGPDINTGEGEEGGADAQI